MILPILITFISLSADDPIVLKECITSVKKGGVISVIGDYYLYANQFPIGPLMEKGITMRGSQVFVQKYWKELLGHIESGRMDPSFLWTHEMPFSRIADAYKIFDEKDDGCLKIIFKTGMTA